MKLSLEWLRDHVPVEESAADVAERFTAAGHAVDGIEEVDGETVLELDITANRPDCLSVRGLAREAAAFYRRPLNELRPMVELRESGPPVDQLFSLRNEVPHLCRRFAARVVRGVRAGPSPGWMAARLRRAGLRPISNLVDLTNYVMLELGHPMHAFDLSTLRGSRLQVRNARRGEKLTTLDGTERTLADWMILIADGERPVSLAGVMGGADTEISGATTDVLLEAAWWDPVTIYRTGRDLGLSSDAAYRFERGADPEGALPALDRCARLMAEIAGGEIASGLVDDYPEAFPSPTLELRAERLSRLLGVDVPPGEISDILARLGFQVGEAGSGRWKVTVPSHRADVTREEDLIEEVGRILGYDRLPERLPAFASAEHGRSAERSAERGIHRLLQGAGFLEALNYTFLARAEDRPFSGWPEEVVALANPMSEAADVLRSSLLPGLVRNAAHNLRNGVARPRLYEAGRVFRGRGSGELPDERLHLGLVAAGPSAPPHWSDGGSGEVDPFDLKGVLEAILERRGLPAPEAAPGGPPFLEPGAALTWKMDGREIAWMGLLAPAAGAPYELERPAAVAELHLGALLAMPAAPVAYEPIPRYPSVARDLSLVLPEECRYDRVEAAIRGAAGEWITDVTPFDRYTGAGLPPGTVAVAVRLWFQHPERTLVSEEVDEAQRRIVQALERDLGARLRG